MQKKTKIYLGLGLLLIMAIVAVIIGSSFSIIEESNEPSCKIDKVGGTCELLLKLPQGQKLAEGYSFDLNVKPIYDEDFKEPQVATFSVVSVPVYYWTYSGNNPIGENTHTFYLYEVPSLGNENVYQYNVTSTSSTTLKTSSTLSGARVYAAIQNGFTRLPYTQSVVEICPYQDDKMCPSDTHLVNVWTDTQNRKDFNYNNMYMSGPTSELTVKSGSSTTPSSTSGELKASVVIDGNTIQKDGKIIVKTNKDVRVYASGTATFTQPVVTVSWKEQYDISDLTVKIGENTVASYPGKLNASNRIYLPSISEFVNEYCGRNGFNARDDECIFKMTFASSRGGDILIASELGVLTPVGGGFNFNSITGWVTFDYKEQPLNAGITIGIAALIFVLIIYFILRKK